MIIVLAAITSAIALTALAIKPVVGVAMLFLVRPLVDTAWDTPLLGGLRLTEIVSAAVPLILIAQMSFNPPHGMARKMPLRVPWLLWSIDVLLFSAIIMFSQSFVDGSNVLLRHLNGLAGFYMVQRYFAGQQGAKRFAWILVLSTVFPVAMGIYEAATGHHWSVTYGEDGVIRNIGLYHDAITIRYYALQALLGCILLYTLSPAKGLLRQVLIAIYAVAALVVVRGAFSKSGTIIVLAWAVAWPTLRRNYKTLLAVGLMAIGGAAYYLDVIMKSIGFIFAKELAAISGSDTGERTFSGRWYLWDDMLHKWSSFTTAQKIFGSGETALGAHNDFLQILYHGGVLGLALYTTLLLSAAVAIGLQLRKRRDPLIVAAAMALIMWIVDAIGLVPSAYSGYQWFVWGVIGLGLCRTGINEEKRVAVPTTARLPAFPNFVGSN